MGQNVLKTFATERSLGWFATLLFLVMFGVSCALMYEDYSTSLAGYRALPTNKVNDWVIPMVAMLPQIGQVGFSYVFLTDTAKQWAGLIAGLLWIVDVATDIYYKSYGMGLAVAGIATIETITIYSIGSELMMVTSIGMLAILLPRQFANIGKSAGKMIGMNTPPGRNGGGGGFKPNHPKGARLPVDLGRFDDD